MGLKPSFWGPHAWVSFKGICEVLDSMSQHACARVRARANVLSADFWSSVPYILPCGICRKSSSHLVRLARRSQVLVTGRGDYNHRVLFILKRAVSRKLFLQEVRSLLREKCSTTVASRRTDTSHVYRWVEYEPSFYIWSGKQVYGTQDFTRSLWKFIYFAVADGSGTRYRRKRVFQFVTELLRRLLPSMLVQIDSSICLDHSLPDCIVSLRRSEVDFEVRTKCSLGESVESRSRLCTIALVLD